MDRSLRFQIYRVLLWIAAMPCLFFCMIGFVLGSAGGDQTDWFTETVSLWVIPHIAVSLSLVVTAEVLILFLRLEADLSDLKQERRDTADLLRGHIPTRQLSSHASNHLASRSSPVGSIVIPPVIQVYSTTIPPKTTAMVRINGLPIFMRPNERSWLTSTGVTFKQGELISIYGRDDSGTWVAVSPGGDRWVAVEGVRLSEDVLSISNIAPPPRT